MKKIYDKIANILYYFGIVVLILSVLIAIGLFGFYIYNIINFISLFAEYDADIEVWYIFLMLLLGVLEMAAIIISGCISTMFIFAISKIIKNGDIQVEQNKEIIRLLSE